MMTRDMRANCPKGGPSGYGWSASRVDRQRARTTADRYPVTRRRSLKRHGPADVGALKVLVGHPHSNPQEGLQRLAALKAIEARSAAPLDFRRLPSPADHQQWTNATPRTPRTPSARLCRLNAK